MSYHQMGEALVLSLTQLKGGYCTNILQPYQDGSWKQIRIRSYPNGPMYPTTVGLSDATIMADWKPGAVIKSTGYREVSGRHRRPTHPEDRLLLSPEVIIDRHCSQDQLIRLVEKAGIIHSGLGTLFPDLCESNHKLYKLPDLFDTSVGYVYCKDCKFWVDTYDKYRFKCLAGDTYVKGAPFKDLHELNRLYNNGSSEIYVGDALVRFALAEPWASPYIGEERCYLMVSHVIKLV